MTGDTNDSTRPAGTLGPLDYPELINMMKALRDAMQLRQEDVAETVGTITTRTIKTMEKGEKTVRPYLLEQVFRALGYELQKESFYVLTPLLTLPGASAAEDDKKG